MGQGFIVWDEKSRQAVQDIVDQHGTIKAAAKATCVSIAPFRSAIFRTGKYVQRSVLERMLMAHPSVVIDDFEVVPDRKTLQAMGLDRFNTWPKTKFFRVDGAVHKLCAGPSHQEPTLVPVKDFYITRTGRNAGKPRSWCKACDSFRKGSVALVFVSRYRFIFRELEHRLGQAEAARRVGLSINGFRSINRGQARRMRRETVAKAMSALQEVRVTGEVRHIDSIRHGSSKRGRPEKKPIHQQDLYHPHGDNDTEQRKTRRRNANL